MYADCNGACNTAARLIVDVKAQDDGTRMMSSSFDVVGSKCLTINTIPVVAVIILTYLFGWIGWRLRYFRNHVIAEITI